MFTEAIEVWLTLFNDMHVQQVMSMVSQHPELTEVLKVQLHITEPVGEPQQIDPVVQAAIKPVDNREGSIPAPIPSERDYSSHASLTLGLNSQEVYSRLSHYLQSIAKLLLRQMKTICFPVCTKLWIVHWNTRPSTLNAN